MTVELNRLLWRCRRGTLEMDLLLEKFVSQQYGHLSPEQMLAFDRLLDYPDNELWDMVTKKVEIDDVALQGTLTLLRQTGMH